MNRFNACPASRLGRGVLFLVTVWLAQGCASAGAGAGTGSGSGDVITREQIGDASNETAFTLVRRLKPAWLRARTQGSLSDPRVCSGNVCTSGEPQFAAVFVDDVAFGDINSLDAISAVQIDRIEYVSALDATTRYGTGYTGGAIMVRTVNRAR